MTLITQNFARAQCLHLTHVRAVRFLTKDSAEATSLHSVVMCYEFCCTSTRMLPEGCLHSNPVQTHIDLHSLY